MGKDPKKKKKVQNRRKKKSGQSPLVTGQSTPVPSGLRVVQKVPEELKTANTLPLFECAIIDGWEETGFAQISIARSVTTLTVHFAIYLVDYYCLGVKDVICKTNQSLVDYRNHVNEVSKLNSRDFKKVDPAFAHNLIYKAIEYGRSNGFEPHEDFAAGQYLLDPIEQYADAPFEFEFGLEGKPFYVQGPEDNVKFILAQLDRVVGRGKYKYASADEFFDTDEDVDIDELPDLVNWVEESAESGLLEDDYFDDDDEGDDDEGEFDDDDDDGVEGIEEIEEVEYEEVEVIKAEKKD